VGASAKNDAAPRARKKARARIDCLRNFIDLRRPSEQG
jgi:hypothetical protein